MKIPFKEIYDKSVELTRDLLGHDLSDKSIVALTILPPFKEWKEDKKLSEFCDLYKEITHSQQEKLIFALKKTRSAAIGNIRGKKLETTVKMLAERYSCAVETQVKNSAIAGELIDLKITTPNGKILYVMCQIDLWGGGHQVNRAEKYLIRKPGEEEHFVSIVYGLYEAPSNTNKLTQRYANHSRLVEAYTQKKLMWLFDLENYLKEQRENSP